MDRDDRESDERVGAPGVGGLLSTSWTRFVTGYCPGYSSLWVIETEKPGSRVVFRVVYRPRIFRKRLVYLLLNLYLLLNQTFFLRVPVQRQESTDFPVVCRDPWSDKVR